MTKVTIRRAEKDDAARVLRDVSRKTLDEFEIAGIAPADAVGEAMERGDPIYVSASDDRVLTLFGFHDYGRYISMWTVATEAFFDMGVAGVVRTRRFFRNLGFDKPLWVITTAPHPDTDRWLEILGFELQRREGMKREFLFVG